MAILSVVRGLGIAASFITAGQHASTSLLAVPNIISLASHDGVAAQTLAQHFAYGLKMSVLTLLPAELLSIISFGFLAYHARVVNPESSSWQFYAGAAVSVFTVIPWTLLYMDKTAKKIVSLARPSAGHPDEIIPKLEHGTLAVPTSSEPAITPIEEFEPYEDAPFSGAEYEKLKVRQLLSSWATANWVRFVSTALAGSLALAAATTRVTLVTIVQGT